MNINEKWLNDFATEYYIPEDEETAGRGYSDLHNTFRPEDFTNENLEIL